MGSRGRPKAKRRAFGRGYAPNPPPGRYSSQHKELARVVTMNATCSMAHLGGCAGPLEADHIVPRSQGGESTMGNLRPLCRRHNRQRGVETKKQNRKLEMTTIFPDAEILLQGAGSARKMAVPLTRGFTT